jgi:hypothetical protein
LDLIKDYDLEIHYHPGKANVVADALSRKAHCNHLPAISISGEESSIRVSPIMVQYNVAACFLGDASDSQLSLSSTD